MKTRLGHALAIYFPTGGAVEADLRDFPAAAEVRWLDLARVTWRDSAPLTGGAWSALTPPAPSAWLALVQPSTRP